MSSLTPPSSSARRIKSSGEVVVKNSDSEDGDSDSSLEDIDQMMTRQKAASALASFQHSIDAQRPGKPVSPPLTRTRDVTTKHSNRATLKSESQRPYRFSLSSLVNQSDKDTAAKERVKRAKSALEAENEEARKDAEARNKAAAADASGDGVIDEAYFASIVDGSDAEEDPQRVIAAMRRTEALQQDLTWYFFDEKANPFWKREPFPSQVLPETGWMTALKRTWERQQAFLTGFIFDMAQIQQLPPEIISWMLDETIFEPRDELAHAYMSILEKCPQALKENFSARRLEAILGGLGGRKSATKLEEAVLPTYRTQDSRSPTPLRLRRLFKALKNFAWCGGLSSEARCYALKTMLRLGLDDSIRADGLLSSGLEDAVFALAQDDGSWERESSMLDVSTSTFATIRHIQLQLRVLQCIPNTNARMEEFRRHLALCFFLDNEACLHYDLQHPSLSSKIINHLRKSPLYDPTPKTNYGDLGASISILDIAINSGFVCLPFSSKEAEADFNQSIDALTQQISTLHNNIVDTGASHMKRTEAKNALERLRYRLEFSVRTKPKPKKNVFGDFVGKSVLDGYAQDSSVMTKFLGKVHHVQSNDA